MDFTSFFIIYEFSCAENEKKMKKKLQFFFIKAYGQTFM